MNEKLSTFAEVGVAIAGFSGVVAALGRNSFDSWPLAKRRIMALLLETSGLVVAFSIVPLVLEELQFSERVLWRTSAGLYVAAHLGHAVILARRGTRLVSHLTLVRARWYAAAVPVLLLQGVSVVVGGLVLLKSVYLLALTWHVLGSAVAFAILLTGRFDQDAA